MFFTHAECVAMENILAKFLAGTLEFQNSSIVKVRLGLKKVHELHFLAINLGKKCDSLARNISYTKDREVGVDHFCFQLDSVNASIINIQEKLKGHESEMHKYIEAFQPYKVKIEAFIEAEAATPSVLMMSVHKKNEEFTNLSQNYLAIIKSSYHELNMAQALVEQIKNKENISLRKRMYG